MVGGSDGFDSSGLVPAKCQTVNMAIAVRTLLVNQARPPGAVPQEGSEVAPVGLKPVTDSVTTHSDAALLTLVVTGLERCDGSLAIMRGRLGNGGLAARNDRRAVW